ncbi:MAG: HypC/HybG/HupF family hydrogenase formation chaperone [Nitrospinae bacterium]|nr:HypC/HybG/HupF family hydrogenase formation chaperone [Nitrospinota bacterium]
MCLAVPMELLSMDGNRGVAKLGGVSREVNLMLVPEVKPGEFVIVHAGCAISVLDREEAEKTIETFRSGGLLPEGG